MKCIIFDLDGTLAESKSSISPEMALALKRLLSFYDVAVISGGAWPQFEKQLINQLDLSESEKKKLHLFPTSGTTSYGFKDGNWIQLYSNDLTDEEVKKITLAFEKLVEEFEFLRPQQSWGQQLENRGSQITFSALGQQAPVEEKRNWDPSFTKRLTLLERLSKMISEFEIRAGGSTSIDVTHKGIDKAYGIYQIQDQIAIPTTDMIFVGDALFPGGNDFAATTTGVECIETSGPEFTLKIIDSFLEIFQSESLL